MASRTLASAIDASSLVTAYDAYDLLWLQRVLYFLPIVANLIDFNIKQFTIMIACVHILDVVIFQNIIADRPMSLLLRRLCILCLLFSDSIGVREASTQRSASCKV